MIRREEERPISASSTSDDDFMQHWLRNWIRKEPAPPLYLKPHSHRPNSHRPSHVIIQRRLVCLACLLDDPGDRPRPRKMKLGGNTTHPRSNHRQQVPPGNSHHDPHVATAPLQPLWRWVALLSLITTRLRLQQHLIIIQSIRESFWKESLFCLGNYHFTLVSFKLSFKLY